MVIDNYDSFLDAKKVLDHLHDKFVEAPSTKEHLVTLEEGLKKLREQTQESLEPLKESLTNIQDCVETSHAVKHIAILLNLNREVQLALIQQDNIEKAIETIAKHKVLIIRTQKEYALEESQRILLLQYRT